MGNVSLDCIVVKIVCFMKVPLLGFRLCKTNESQQSLALFTELKFCMTDFYFLN